MVNGCGNGCFINLALKPNFFGTFGGDSGAAATLDVVDSSESGLTARNIEGTPPTGGPPLRRFEDGDEVDVSELNVPCELPGTGLRTRSVVGLMGRSSVIGVDGTEFSGVGLKIFLKPGR